MRIAQQPTACDSLLARERAKQFLNDGSEASGQRNSSRAGTPSPLSSEECAGLAREEGKMETWTDTDGVVRKVPQIIGRLKPGKCPGHAALRAFVISRDGSLCVRCGSAERLVADHIISRRNGGSHHPDNLQCLCDSCNARKAGKEDRRHA